MTEVWAVWDGPNLVGLFQREADARELADSPHGAPLRLTRERVMAGAPDIDGTLTDVTPLDLRAQFSAERRTRWSEADADGNVTVHYNVTQLLTDLMTVVHSGDAPSHTEALADHLLVQLAAELGVALASFEPEASDE